MENVKKNIEELVSCIQNSPEYQKCVQLKKRMADNPLIVDKIEQIKKMQKKVVSNHYDKKMQEQLDSLIEELENIPIYVVYNQHLELVNQKIDYVRDSLNDYFQSLFEKDTKN